ncbi:hypothetical protein SHIRM173S_01547 [Streptomyces hirsutus]
MRGRRDADEVAQASAVTLHGGGFARVVMAADVLAGAT